jgi:hypothetical protein
MSFASPVGYRSLRDPGRGAVDAPSSPLSRHSAGAAALAARCGFSPRTDPTQLYSRPSLSLNRVPPARDRRGLRAGGERRR